MESMKNEWESVRKMWEICKMSVENAFALSALISLFFAELLAMKVLGLLETDLPSRSTDTDPSPSFFLCLHLLCVLV